MLKIVHFSRQQLQLNFITFKSMYLLQKNLGYLFTIVLNMRIFVFTYYISFYCPA